MADKDLRQSRAYVLQQLLGMTEDERGDLLGQLPRAELLAIALEGLEINEALGQVLAIRPEVLPSPGSRSVSLDRHPDGGQAATVGRFYPHDEGGVVYTQLSGEVGWQIGGVWPAEGGGGVRLFWTCGHCGTNREAGSAPCCEELNVILAAPAPSALTPGARAALKAQGVELHHGEICGRDHALGSESCCGG